MSVWLCVVAATLGSVSGSHFRYGTMSYVPTENTGTVNGRASQEIEITFEAVFRRNYDWGRLQQESWQQTSSPLGSPPNLIPADNAWNCSTSLCPTTYDNLGLSIASSSSDSTRPEFDNPSEYEEDANGNGVFNEVFFMRFPPYQGENSNGNVILGRNNEFVEQCPGAFYCDIVRPGCSASDYTWETRSDGITNADGTTNDYSQPAISALPASTAQCNFDPLIWDPRKCGEWQSGCAGLKSCAVYTAGFYVDASDPSRGIKLGATCADWFHTYGMYMGDGMSRTMVLTSTEISVSCLTETECADSCPGYPDEPCNVIGCQGGRECSQLTGNFIRGTEYFTYDYPVDSQSPYLVVFTGGNRLFQCGWHVVGGVIYNPGLDPTGKFCSTYTDAETDPAAWMSVAGGLNNLLQNNAEGRYRLEMEVWLKSGDILNESPVAYQEAVLPVVRSVSYDHRTPFQIPAFDQNTGDYLVFAFGNAEEMGGITKSKLNHYPYNEAQTDVNAKDYFTQPGTTASPNRQFGPATCNAEVNTGNSRYFRFNATCPDDRTPRAIWGTKEFSFTTDVPGLVEWRTYFPKEGGDGYTDPALVGSETDPDNRVMNGWTYEAPLPNGLYNMVVMVYDVALKVDPVDAEEYVGADGSFDYDSLVDTEIMDLYSYTYPTKLGEANVPRTVFDPRFNLTFPYKSKVPLDYLLYLYEGPTKFCNKACKDSKTIGTLDSVLGGTDEDGNVATPNAEKVYGHKNGGVSTFQNSDGVYGATFPQTEEEMEIQGYMNTNYPDQLAPGVTDFFSSADDYAAPDGTTLDKFLRRRSQECTICGYGSIAGGYCSAPDSEGECTSSDVSEGASGANANGLVPPAGACQENTRPYFTRWEYDDTEWDSALWAGLNYDVTATGEHSYGNYPTESTRAAAWLDDHWLGRPVNASRRTDWSSTTLWDQWQCTVSGCDSAPFMFQEGIPTLVSDATFARAAPTSFQNAAPFYKVENNVGVRTWYQAGKHIKTIVPELDADVVSGDPRWVDYVTRFPFTNLATYNVTYDRPVYKIFKADKFEFYVSAKDDDDCVELTLKHSGLPRTRATVVDGVAVVATQSVLHDEEVFSYTPEFPQGAMLRRRFEWNSPSSNPKFDTRPEVSFVCFIASDMYLLTNEPLYCIELEIMEEQPEVEILKECFCRTCNQEPLHAYVEVPTDTAGVGKYTGLRVNRTATNFAPRTPMFMGQMTDPTAENYKDPVELPHFFDETQNKREQVGGYFHPDEPNHDALSAVEGCEGNPESCLTVTK